MPIVKLLHMWHDVVRFVILTASLRNPYPALQPFLPHPRIHAGVRRIGHGRSDERMRMQCICEEWLAINIRMRIYRIQAANGMDVGDRAARGNPGRALFVCEEY